MTTHQQLIKFCNVKPTVFNYVKATLCAVTLYISMNHYLYFSHLSQFLCSVRSGCLWYVSALISPQKVQSV